VSRIRLLFSEAWASIRQNISTTFAATMTVLIGMFILGLFIALGTWGLSYSHHVQKELQVKVNFCTKVSSPPCAGDATQAQEVAVVNRLRADHRDKKVVYVSKAQAEKTMRKEYPQLYSTPLTDNPLPDSWVVTPVKASDVPAIGRDVQAAHLPGVDQVKWASTTTKRVLTVVHVVSVIFLIATILLVVASTLLIANTIRLSIFARRREIEVMKLVGATNWFVRGPFMLEGLLCGLAGSALAVVLLVLGKQIALPLVVHHLDSGSDVHAWPFYRDAVLLVGAGLLLGAAGSGLTLRRFLQV
jgi:cell division transport system permease protein